MKLLISFALIIFSINIAQARIYKCLDDKGQAAYGVVPCKKTRGAKQIHPNKPTNDQETAQLEKKLQDERNNERAKRIQKYMEYRLTKGVMDAAVGWSAL